MEHIFDNICTELEYMKDENAFNQKLRAADGPTFIGQGGSKSSGSDCYGYYWVEKKELKNGKVIWGYASAKSHFAGHWTEGTEVCDGPYEWKAEGWMTTWGKYKDGKPKWWECDENGKRFKPGRKCRVSWTGAHAYRDPSF